MNIETRDYRHVRTGERMATSQEVNDPAWQRWDRHADDEGRFRNMSQVKAANNRAGGFWFTDTDAKIIGNIGGTGRALIAGRYWVEAKEGFYDTDPNTFRACAIDPSGAIRYLGEYQQFKTIDDAYAYIQSVINA